MRYPWHLLSLGRCLALSLALALIGCSMHPLPENVSRASTFDIVERIRCEVLEGLQEFSLDDRRANKIIAATTIGYDFDFKIEEKTGSGGGELEYRRASFKNNEKGFFLELGGAAQAERKNVRSFRIVDKLADLRAERAVNCSKPAATANGLYPITGATGMAEVVRTYVKLELLTDLAAYEKSEVFSDELAFTTKLSVGTTTTLELRTIAGQFRLSHASLAGNASRDDIHNVTVALTRGPGDVDIVRGVERIVDQKARSVVAAAIADPVIRPYRTLRRVAATQAGAETRVINELQRRRNAREDQRAVSRVLFGTD